MRSDLQNVNGQARLILHIYLNIRIKQEHLDDGIPKLDRMLALTWIMIPDWRLR